MSVQTFRDVDQVLDPVIAAEVERDEVVQVVHLAGRLSRRGEEVAAVAERSQLVGALHDCDFPAHESVGSFIGHRHRVLLPLVGECLEQDVEQPLAERGSFGQLADRLVRSGETLDRHDLVALRLLRGLERFKLGLVLLGEALHDSLCFLGARELSARGECLERPFGI